MNIRILVCSLDRYSFCALISSILLRKFKFLNCCHSFMMLRLFNLKALFFSGFSCFICSAVSLLSFKQLLIGNCFNMHSLSLSFDSLYLMHQLSLFSLSLNFILSTFLFFLSMIISWLRQGLSDDDFYFFIERGIKYFLNFSYFRFPNFWCLSLNDRLWGRKSFSVTYAQLRVLEAFSSSTLAFF